MKKCALTAGLFVFIASLVMSQDTENLDHGFKTAHEQRFKVKPGVSMVLADINGDVVIESWDKNEIFVSEDISADVFTRDEAQTIIQRLKDNYVQDGNTVRITGLGERVNYESDFFICVPEKINIKINNNGGDLNLTALEGKIVLQTSGGDIECQDISGHTRVNTSGGDLTFRNISGKLEASTSGGDIDLEEIYAESNLRTSGGDITLVRATHIIKLMTSGGDITAKSCEGELYAETIGGDIEISDVAGRRININTNGGDISIERLSGNIHAVTTGGDITGSGFSGRLSTATRGGDIDLDDIKGAVHANTMGGNIDARITLADFSQPHDINMNTTAGDMTLYLPAGLPASITAEIFTSSNRSSWERNDIFSDFPLIKSMPDETDGHIIRSKGDINGGGDKIILKVKRGDIHIKKIQ